MFSTISNFVILYLFEIIKQELKERQKLHFKLTCIPDQDACEEQIVTRL